MKKLWVLLVILMFAAPNTVPANAQGAAPTDAPVNAPADVPATAKIDFNAKCAKCHRANKLLPKTAKLLEVDPGKLALRNSKMSRDEMIAITEKGRDKMPGFEKELTKEQIADIVDYILFLKNRKK